MSWNELETRLRQEFSKRLDVALCGIGLHPGRDGIRGSRIDSGRFFFAPDDLPRRIQLLRQHLPNPCDKIVAEADDICRHQFRLLGYRDLFYGEQIDWHLDAVHNRRAPLIPWYKIDFLNFEAVGDHKVTWELNRHQHFVTLAKAWLMTNDNRYADEIFAQWYSWQRANPYPMGPNWASSLEVAFRSLSWIWVDHLIAQCPSAPAEFKDELLRGLALHGRHIERYLSTYFSPNTHLLGEAVALFFLGTLYPQISASKKWVAQGWAIVQDELVRQVRPDGVYFEQTLYYHVYALDFLIYARLLASRNGMDIPAALDETIRKMLGLVQALAQASPADGFGDDDGGRLFDSSRNRAENMTDPMALGSALYRDDASLYAGDLTEEAIWLFGEEALQVQKNSAGARLESRSFPDGGIYVFAGSETTEQLVIDAGPQGTGHSGHGHADALSVRFSFAGRRWLVDAGTCWYIGPGNDRNAFRGTRAHNTLAVDGLDQAVPQGPFAWSEIPETKVEMHTCAPTFTYFAASHSGYERLAEPVRHRRFVFHRRKSFWLIRDVAAGEGEHLLETSWHFAPGLSVQTRDGHCSICAEDDSVALNLTPVDDPQWTLQVVSEFVSPAYGEKVGAQVLRCSARARLPVEHAMLLSAKANEDSCGSLVRVVFDQENAPHAIYRYDCLDASYWMIFNGAENRQWSFGPFQSDAKFLYFFLRNRRISELMACDASFTQLQGRRVFSHASPLEWIEWSQNAGVACSAVAAQPSFSREAIDTEIII